MSASSRDTSRSASPWAASPWAKHEIVSRQRAGRRHGDRLPWPLAVPLIVLMCVVCWVVIWKSGAAVLALLH